MSFEVISNERFENLIEIKFKNILDGFNSYNYIELSSKGCINNAEEDFIKAIEYFYEINEGNLIIDFYKKNLDENSIDYIKKNLDDEDNIYFDELIELSNNIDIFYKVNSKKYIKLLTKLCTRELYFITFYFYKDPVTIWGNYNLKFPLFYNEKTNLDCYIKISKINKIY